jgi:hypothetical protein
MEDLANIVAVMFVVWIVSGVALLLLAWLAPLRWSRPLRVALMLVAAGVAVFLTGALFGIASAALAGIAAAVAIYLGLSRG